MYLKQITKDHKKYALADLTEAQRQKLHGDYKPGCRAIIKWEFKDGKHKWKLTDKGYCFELPGMDGEYDGDFFIHVPCPDGQEKGDNEPIWMHINQILQMGAVKSVSLK